MIPAWDAENERSAKEILYHCLEQLGCTKAALYLVNNEGVFELATQYGFSRRDTLGAEVRPGDPLWDWVRRHRTAPAFLNEVRDDAKLAAALEGAATARLMTVPLTVSDRLVGLVDLRDKARRLPFSTEDIPRARSIGMALEGWLREIGAYGPPTPSKPLATPLATSTEKRAPGLHASVVSGLAAQAGSLASLPGAAAIALTVTDGSAVHVAVYRSTPLDAQQRDALVSHQSTRLLDAGLRLPAASRWAWSEEECASTEKRGEEIRTAVLHAGPPVWIAMSVLTPAVSATGETILAVAQGSFDSLRCLSEYRRAARNLCRILLEPGEESFPHLRQHSQAVSELAQRMAAVMRLDDNAEELVTVAGYLHDVGMRELEYGRIYRMERPGETERRIYQRHPVVGARIVDASEFPGDLAGAVRHHHERWDGSGYPERLAGRLIPFTSRVIHLAEVYDTLTSPSSYRRQQAREGALDLIRGEAGRQFDPDLVPVLEEAVRP